MTHRVFSFSRLGLLRQDVPRTVGEEPGGHLAPERAGVSRRSSNRGMHPSVAIPRRDHRHDLEVAPAQPCGQRPERDLTATPKRGDDRPLGGERY